MNSSINITFLDALTLNPGDLSWDVLSRLGNFTTYDRTPRADIPARAAEADIIITNKTPLGEREFSALPRLRLVCVAATGFDVVDTVAARRHGVAVCNCPGYGTKAVAQMVVAHLLEVANRVGSYTRQNREDGFWAKSRDFCCWNEPLMELDGKRLAVIGFGNIGRAVTDLLRPFGMRLHAVTSRASGDLPSDVHKVSLEEAFATMDVISLCCPLTRENEAFVNADLLANSNSKLILINTARGRLIDESAVADALREGHLGAYCCDVLSTEPPAADNPILNAPRTFVTPHIAWATPDARTRILHIIANNITSYLTKGVPDNQVN